MSTLPSMAPRGPKPHRRVCRGLAYCDWCEAWAAGRFDGPPDRVIDSGFRQREIASAAGITEKHLSQMMHQKSGSLHAWQRVMDAIATLTLGSVA